MPPLNQPNLRGMDTMFLSGLDLHDHSQTKMPRSLCYATFGAELATEYGEAEYAAAQALCTVHARNATNCSGVERKLKRASCRTPSSPPSPSCCSATRCASLWRWGWTSWPWAQRRAETRTRLPVQYLSRAVSLRFGF